MAPNGKPASYAMQQQRSPVQSIQDQVTPKDANIQVKRECILFSQSIMSGRWNTSNNSSHAEQTSTAPEGPEPRVLSKKRRDLINAEIRELQNLLPLKKSARERLSYLGILALTNTFIRKATFFKKECVSYDATISSSLVPEFSSSVYGFLLVFNREGKILYTSDNILDYLGNTVVELASQGDSIYDFVDKEDHDQIRAQLEVPPHDDHGEARKLSFFCRMSTSRYMKTQMRSWKNKIVHVTGRYHKPSMSNDWSDTVFFAVCTPIESKPVTDVRHHPSPRVAEFKAVHSADMQFLEVSEKVQDLLGYQKEELENTSWYQLIYPEDLELAKQQHLKFVKEDGSTFSCVLRMIKKDGTTVWVDITAEKSQESIGNSFVCNYIIIDEEEVPYFRLHHNLLPFPEHYSDAQRQYLAYRSTLLSAALHSEIASANSAMTSPSGIHPSDSNHFSLAQQIYANDMDTKTILRRQLIKRKMTSSDFPLCANPASYIPEIYGMPPNKMLIRSASELPYPTIGAYHVPLQHSSSFPEGSLHPHMLYRGLSSEEAYLTQFHNPNSAHGYLFDGGYNSLASTRKHSFTFHPSQRSPLQNGEPVSPVSAHSVQHNQNNNAQTVHHDEQYYSSNYPSPCANKSPYHDTTYSHPAGSPHSQVSSPGASDHQSSPLHYQSPVRHLVNGSGEGLLPDVDNISEENFRRNSVASICGSVAASSPHALMHRQQCSSSSYGSNLNPASYPQTNKLQSTQHQMSLDSCSAIPSSHSFANECNWNQISYSSASIHPNNLPSHHLKEEILDSPPQCGVINPHCNSPQSMMHPGSPYNQGSVSPVRSSPNPYPASSCSQMISDGYDASVTEKPYHVQYSISSASTPSVQRYPAVNQVGHVEGGFDWMKKCRNAPNMEMLISGVEGSHRLA